MKMVEVDKLTVTRGGNKVLHEVSLNVEQGAFYMIIGPNGAGKTTLLKALSGLIKPDRGAITIQGRDIRRFSARELARILAMVPQQVALDFPFRVAETVLMGRSPHLDLLAFESRHDRELAQQAMDFTDVSHLAQRRLDEVSGGERQRVIIARAICQQPQIILLDEPTASLDPAHQLKIMDLLERLRHQGVTVIMVSHDLNLAGVYGDTLVLLKDGEVACLGSPEQVLTEEQLQTSYECSLMVDENPVSKRPRINLLPERYR
ncbi:MAG: heme ABC transporter ATP-binding protein [Proteobacteria bacterium]|nr:heme ABC transporter ATP-binding protein [Pseudomonadota bacterium]MBU1138428.1 heme ABC transporter ATP-binding protein [Pseudomonadota bacterium]MBU1231402.1 heme ABC transporter ATP-binding protein [Pseudomonadota bacterium]MBU1418487.1 heme ABC transporter ATP-binding protein [Pseudomonadota bacterium]MBU1455008.1 heme ABC transporter ATP-binding protein [Pseudomonadota bacterium]